MFISNVTDVPAICFRRSLLQDMLVRTIDYHEDFKTKQMRSQRIVFRLHTFTEECF
jgi:hypothetical protein